MQDDIFVAGDLNVELGLLYRKEEDDDLQEIYGPQYWCFKEAYPGGLKIAIWLEIMMEFTCIALSSLLGSDDGRERKLSRTKLRRERTNIAAGLHSGTVKNCAGACYIRDETQFCSTWDHYAVYATINDEKMSCAKHT